MFEYLGWDKRKLRPGTRPFAREVDIGDARIFVDHGFQWDGTRNVWLTRARASYVLGSGPIFELKPRALLARVTGFFGGTPSGDPCFDDFFSVRTASADATWSALTTRVRSLLAGSFEDARLISDGQMVSLWREADFGLESDASAAVEVVAEIVQRHSQVLDALKRLPGVEPVPATGPWHARTVASVRISGPVKLEPSAGLCGPVMSARAECGRALRKFTVHVDPMGKVHGQTDRLPEHALFLRDGTDGLGACDIQCDGRAVVLRWRELALSKARLVRGAKLVAWLSRPTGLYR